MAEAGAEPRKAQVVVYLGPNSSPNYEIQQHDLPEEVADGEVLVKVTLSTVCGSDLHTLGGKRTTPFPCVMGHEGCGVVVRSSREGLAEGTRVTWPICDCCGACAACEVGLENKCHALLKFGHTLLRDAALFGTYASHVLLRRGVAAVQLPQALSDEVAAPANCALATMVNALAGLPQAPPAGNPGARVALVQGAGLLGIYGCCLLKEAGYETVYCTDFSDTRLELVPLFGGTPVPLREEEALVPAGGVDVAFEVCGNKAAVPGGLRALRTGGTYVLVGLIHPDSQLDLTAELLIKRLLTVKGVHNYAARHLRQAVAFLEATAGKYPYHRLVGTQFPLGEFPAALAAAHRGQYHRVALRP